MAVSQAEHQTNDIMPVPQHTDLASAQPPAFDSAPTDAVLDSEVLPAEPQVKEPTSKGPLLKHINFWHEDELKMAHPEVQASSPVGYSRFCQFCSIRLKLVGTFAMALCIWSLAQNTVFISQHTVRLYTVLPLSFTEVSFPAITAISSTPC